MSSCISNKKIVYLQDKTQSKPHDALVVKDFSQKKSDFILLPEDVISVRINHLILSPDPNDQFLNDDFGAIRNNRENPLINGFRVDDEGNVDLPTLGKIQVANMTLDEAEDKILEVAQGYYTNPTVKCYMLNFNISILGEVRRPGRYPVYNSSFNLFEALGMANDAGDFANRNGVKIIRTRNNQNKLYHVDLTDENILSSEAFYLQPNDIVLIAPLKRKKFSGRGAQGFYNGLGIIVSVASLAIISTR